MTTVNSMNSQNQNPLKSVQPNFGQIKLDKVKLRVKSADGSYQLADAFVSKLESKSIRDKKLLDKLYDNWYNTEYTHNVIVRFNQLKDFSNLYITKLKKNCKALKDNICSLIETTNPKANDRRDDFVIKYIQAAPEIANKSDKPVKGAGELAVYEAVKTAKENNYKRISLYSTNDNFFTKLGFEKDENSHNFVLKKDKFDSFLEKVEQKYEIKK